MSERPTPETDAMVEKSWQTVNFPTNPVPADFARRLERDLSEVLESLGREREALLDPVVVHHNMLRGTIAKISFAQFSHLMGDDFTARAKDAGLLAGNDADSQNQNALHAFLAAAPFTPDDFGRMKDSDGDRVITCNEECPPCMLYKENMIDADAWFMCPKCGRLGQRMVEATLSQVFSSNDKDQP